MRIYRVTPQFITGTTDNYVTIDALLLNKEITCNRTIVILLNKTTTASLRFS